MCFVKLYEILSKIYRQPTTIKSILVVYRVFVSSKALKMIFFAQIYPLEGFLDGDMLIPCQWYVLARKARKCGVNDISHPSHLISGLSVC